MRGEDGFMYLQLIRFESTTRSDEQQDTSGYSAANGGDEYDNWDGQSAGEVDELLACEELMEVDEAESGEGDYETDEFVVRNKPVQLS